MTHVVKKEDFFGSVFTNERDFTTVKIYFDGSCGPVNTQGNNMGYGWYLEGDGEPLAEGWGYTLPEVDPKSSNNKAEWKAAQCGLRMYSELNITCEVLKIRGDSNMVISQLRGDWRIKEFGAYRDIAIQTIETYKYLINKASIYHIYRDRNKICDELSNRYIEYLNNNGYDLKVRGEKPKSESQKSREKSKRKELKNKKEKVLYLDSLITFGKYKEDKLTLGEINIMNPDYVKWMRDNTDIIIKFESENKRYTGQSKPNRR